MLLQCFLWLLAEFIFSYTTISAERIKSLRIYSLVNVVIFLLICICSVGLYSLDPRNVGLLMYIIGASLNTMVIIANKGLMPVDIKAVQRMFNLSELSAKIELDIVCKARRQHTIMTNSTKFNILGDNILEDRYDPSICSAGDILITGGVILAALQLILFLILGIA